MRNAIKPGDLSTIVQLHGKLYEEEYGLDETFEAYVAGPISSFILQPDPGQRLWVVEKDGKVLDSIAIVKNGQHEAQLRWFILHPSLRGKGLGKKLVSDAIEFSRRKGYGRIILWTFSELTSAASIYKANGFTKIEEKTHPLWDRESITEEKY